MSGLFDAPDGMPQIEHAIVDEETQMLRYLAEVALEDMRLLPPEKNRNCKPGSLLAQYREDVAARHLEEAQNDRAPVQEVVLEEATAGSDGQMAVAEVARTSVTVIPVPERKEAVEFIGKEG